MSKQKLKEWITPLEASLEMSVRKGYYVSPDDIKQLRSTERLPESAYMVVSKRASIYNRQAIRDFTGSFNKREQREPEAATVSSWLWEFPETIAALEKEGFSIPLKDEGLAVLKEQEQQKQYNPRPQLPEKKPRKRKTHSQNT